MLFGQISIYLKSEWGVLEVGFSLNNNKNELYMSNSNFNNNGMAFINIKLEKIYSYD